MPAGPGDRLDDRFAAVGREVGELLRGQLLQVLRRVHAVEDPAALLRISYGFGALLFHFGIPSLRDILRFRVIGFEKTASFRPRQPRFGNRGPDREIYQLGYRTVDTVPGEDRIVMERIKIGSEEHGRLFCNVFVDTHRPFRAQDIRWPDLDEVGLQRLKGLPVWNEAARTEAATAVKVQTLGEEETDPILKEAIALQGYEEGRHAEIIALLTRHYGIPVAPAEEPQRPKNPTWTFLRTGYGECLDSFFAFGLFDLGRQTRFFHEDLIALFDQIMQEEARHILFIVNWAAYLRARQPVSLRPAFDTRRAWNVVAQAFDRVKG